MNFGIVVHAEDRAVPKSAARGIGEGVDESERSVVLSVAPGARRTVGKVDEADAGSAQEVDDVGIEAVVILDDDPDDLAAVGRRAVEVALALDDLAMAQDRLDVPVEVGAADLGRELAAERGRLGEGEERRPVRHERGHVPGHRPSRVGLEQVDGHARIADVDVRTQGLEHGGADVQAQIGRRPRSGLRSPRFGQVRPPHPPFRIAFLLAGAQVADRVRRGIERRRWDGHAREPSAVE